MATTAINSRRLLDFAPLLLLLVLTAVFAAIDSRVVSGASIVNIVAQATPIALLGLGTLIVVLTAGIDLSAGVGVALCSIVIAGRVDAGTGLFPALLIGLAAMAGLGLINGLIISVLRIPPFVTTLATMVAVQGATLALARKGVVIVKEPWLKAIGVDANIRYPQQHLADGSRGSRGLDADAAYPFRPAHLCDRLGCGGG